MDRFRNDDNSLEGCPTRGKEGSVLNISGR